MTSTKRRRFSPSEFMVLKGGCLMRQNPVTLNYAQGFFDPIRVYFLVSERSRLGFVVGANSALRCRHFGLYVRFEVRRGRRHKAVCVHSQA